MKEPAVTWGCDSEKIVKYPEQRFDLDRKASKLLKLQIREKEAVIIVWKILGKVAEVTPKPSRRMDRQLAQ